MRSDHKLNWTRKPALVIIGLVIIFFTIVTMLGVGDNKESEDAISKVESKVATKKSEDNKISDLSLYFACKPKIQEQLANPKSFDPSALSVKYNFVGNQHIIGFDFYAKNGFGGEVMQQGVCSFDVEGNILEYGVV